MDIQTIASGITEGQVVGDTILKTIETLDPGVALPAETAEMILDLVSGYTSKWLGAYSAAAGIPITPESVAALMPDETPLTAPDA